MSDTSLEPGTVLAEKYRIDSVLGEGGMGTVYRAEHLILKAPVAVKVIDREVAEGDVALARFTREAQAAAGLRSPHVVQILDYGADQGRPFMVMEVLEGESLADRLDKRGTLSPPETYRVISHVARAVAKAHEQGIVHRDLKPDNIFLVHNEGDEIAKVLDFGVAKVESTAMGEGSHTRTGSLLGTPYYMSPEQAQGNKEIDARSDLWALGVIAFECLTGTRPFSSDGLGDLVLQICIRDIPVPSQVRPVPSGFDAWFARATERDVETRFQSARELSEGLRSSLGLGREGSIPESAWSIGPNPNLTPGPGRTSQRPTRQQPPAATDPRSSASTPNPSSDAPLPPGIQAAAGGATAVSGAGYEGNPESARTIADGGAAARGSQWEVVPRGSAVHAPTDLAFADTDAGVDDGGAGKTIFFVAVSALILGAAAVYGAQQAGIEVLPPEMLERWTSTTASPPADSPKASDTSTPRAKKLKAKKKGTSGKASPAPSDAAAANAADTDEPASAEDDAADGTPDGGDLAPEAADGSAESATDADAPVDEDAGPVSAADRSASGAAEEPADATAQDSPPEGDALDAIESEAAKKAAEQEPAPAQPKPDGPTSALPEGLAPPPPPPPPSE